MYNSISSTRQINTSSVLQSIINNQHISRAQISEVTGLNKATVSSIVKALIEEEIIIETGEGNSSDVGGRKPIMLGLNVFKNTIIALEVGPTFIIGELTYLNGKTIKKFSNKKLVVTKDNIEELIINVVKLLKTDKNNIIGLGIAVHGTTYKNNIIYTPYYDLDEVNLYKILQKKFDFPIVIENEANANAVGEYTFGNHSNTLVSMSIHTGIGIGSVIKGEIQSGFSGKAGAIGHSILFPNGIKCPCGNRGCLEQYASNRVVYDKIKFLRKIPEIDSTIIAELYARGDEEIIDYLDDICLYISIGVNNLIALNDPETVIISSSLFYKIPSLLDNVMKYINNNFVDKNKLVTSSLNNRATILGLVALTLQNHLNVTNLKIIH